MDYVEHDSGMKVLVPQNIRIKFSEKTILFSMRKIKIIISSCLIFICSCTTMNKYPMNENNFPLGKVSKDSLWNKAAENSPLILRSVDHGIINFELNKKTHRFFEIIRTADARIIRYLGYLGDNKVQETQYHLDGSVILEKFILGRRVIKMADYPDLPDLFETKDDNITYPIGITKYFDSTGRVEKKINWNTELNFGINKVKSKIKHLGIDLSTCKISVNGKNYWAILYRNEKDMSLLLLSIKTGETIQNKKLAP